MSAYAMAEAVQSARNTWLRDHARRPFAEPSPSNGYRSSRRSSACRAPLAFGQQEVTGSNPVVGTGTVHTHDGTPRLLASRTALVPARPDPARYRGHFPFRHRVTWQSFAPARVNTGCTA